MICIEPIAEDAFTTEMRLVQNIGVQYRLITDANERFVEPIPPRSVVESQLNPLVRAIIRALIIEFRVQLTNITIMISTDASEAEMLANVELAVLERTVLMCGTEINRRKDAEAIK